MIIVCFKNLLCSNDSDCCAFFFHSTSRILQLLNTNDVNLNHLFFFWKRLHIDWNDAKWIKNLCYGIVHCKQRLCWDQVLDVLKIIFETLPENISEYLRKFFEVFLLVILKWQWSPVCNLDILCLAQQVIQLSYLAQYVLVIMIIIIIIRSMALVLMM